MCRPAEIPPLAVVIDVTQPIVVPSLQEKMAYGRRKFKTEACCNAIVKLVVWLAPILVGHMVGTKRSVPLSSTLMLFARNVVA